MKLAYGLRWQDLEGRYPVRLCQDFYRSLYRRGFIQSINEQLHWDLNLNGISTLEALVDQGCFTIKGDRIILSPSEKLTWEKLTALFLLQQGFRAQRASLRQVTVARRHRGGYWRLPPRLSGTAQRPAHYRPPAPVSFPFPPPLPMVRPVLTWKGVGRPPASSSDLGVGPVSLKRFAPVAAALRGPPSTGRFPVERLPLASHSPRKAHQPSPRSCLEKTR